MKVTDPEVEVVQRCYPQIYLACHGDHVRSRSTQFRLSARDSSILAHLSPDDPLTPTALAAHLGVSGSTLSAAVSKLEKLGYIKRTAIPEDRRSFALTLTRPGAKAMAATSVLDHRRVAEVLDKLSPSKRRRALEGLKLLADASRQRMIQRRSRS
jgi:DNA-binding MarR family transcriptional regulator